MIRRLFVPIWIALFFASPVISKDVDYLKVIVLDAESHTPIAGATVKSKVAMFYEDQFGGLSYDYEIREASTNSEGIAFIQIGLSRYHMSDTKEALNVTHREFRPFETSFCWGDLKDTVGFKNKHVGKTLFRMTIASPWRSADEDKHWSSDHPFIEDSDMTLAVIVLLKPIPYRYRN